MNSQIYFNEENAPFFYWNGVEDKVMSISFMCKYIDIDLTKFDLYIFTRSGNVFFTASVEGIHAIHLSLRYTYMDWYREAPGAIAEYGHRLMNNYVLVDNILPDQVVFKSTDTEEELADIPHNYNEVVYADWLLCQSLRSLANQRLWYIIRGVMLRYADTARSTRPTHMHKIMGARQSSREK